ncbi:hypothetical protein [Isoptericola jiangsuensis]|uniref:hypothetical protein n=1 Tax=Isoptericola jiangsuensis TaxID=548579 RepID=UPI0011452241|nr:hypothetical protein [Isoptericola jiangsuensis]
MTNTAVIVLDGASAFVPVDVPTSTYVDTFGNSLIDGLAAKPQIPLADLVAQSIKETSSALDLHPDAAPSSTVAIARHDDEGLDLFVLGDSQIATPHGVYVDTRIDGVAQEERARYRARLAQGYGFDETHRELLRALQAEQARHRNADDGFWIAEAAPNAARHGLEVRMSLDTTPWLVLATDGAYRPMRHLSLDVWANVAKLSGVELASLMRDLDTWEDCEDPDGLTLPRAKRHDDKALAVIRYG